MSQLVFDNWLTLDGTPVTGATPPRLVLQGGRLTDARYLEVQQVYRHFCMAKTTSVTNNLTADYEFADGTRVSIDSVQGVDSVFVLAPDDEELDRPPHGIGICFTGRESEPLGGFAYAISDDEVAPLPFILVPSIDPSSTEWPYLAGATWSAINVTRLVGGQQLWVHETGKDWASNFCLQFQATPAALVVSVLANPLSLPTVKPEWAASSRGRIGLVTVVGGDPDAPRQADSGRYIFRSNDTLQLNGALFSQKAFFADLDLGQGDGPRKYRLVIVPSQTELRMYRAPYAEIKGLAEEDADLSGPSTYLNDQTTYTPSDGTVRFEPNTLSIHPNGKLAKCIARKTTGQNGLYADIAIGASLEVSIVNPGIEQALAGNASGSYARAATRITEAIVEPATTRYLTCDSTFEDPVFVDGPYERLKVSRTDTTTVNGTASASASTRNLNRHYYDQAGNTVTEIVETHQNGTTFLSIDSQVKFDLGYHEPGSIPQRTTSIGIQLFSNTTIVSQISADITTTQTLGGNALAGSPLVIERLIANLDETATGNVVGTGSPTFSVSANGNYLRTVRTVLYCDEINDFALYLESQFTMTVSGSRTDNPVVPLGTFGSLNTLITASGATATIKGVRNGAEVFSHTLGQLLFQKNATSVLPSVYAGQSGSVLGLAAMNAWTFDLPVVHDTDFGYPAEVVSYQAYPQTYRCPNGRVSTYPEINHDEPIPSEDFRIPYYSVTESGTARIPPVVPSLSMSWTQDPRSYMEVRFARDPLTLACVVNLTFYGSRMGSGGNPDQTWSFAVTKSAFKTVQQVMADMDRPLPDNAWIYPDATLHSLVSI